MRFLIFLIALLTLQLVRGQYTGFVNDRVPDRNGDYMVYRTSMGGKDSVIFFSLTNGERMFEFANCDMGRDLQLAKAGITFQRELQAKLRLSSRTFMTDKRNWKQYIIEYLSEVIGADDLDMASHVDGLFVDVRSKSVVLFALKDGHTNFYNVTWRTGDDPARVAKPFRTVHTTKDYFTRELIFSPDGNTAYVDGRLYNFKKNKEVWNHLKRPLESPKPGALSADALLIAVPNDENRIDILNFKTGKVIRQLAPLPPIPEEYEFFRIAPSSDMKTYVVCFIHKDKNRKIDYMVFEDGRFKQLTL